MNQGIYSLSATMINQLNRVDVISNNIANANTTGFKQDNLVEGSFNYYLQKAQKNDTNISKDSLVHNTIPKIDGDYIKGDVGSITTTGNKLDFALTQNETFFKLEDKNKNILYTRDGSFKNLNGFLTTAQGDKILNLDNEPIRIQEGFENQIALVKTPFTNLDKVGSNNYKANDRIQVENIVLNDTQMLQGSIERSNVNTIGAMVALIDSQRRLEQSQKAIRGIDELNGKLITQVGNSI
ncbi:MAG TPA: flagellar hook-basal body complex protein [Arcobacter sp.]|nr:flagellar hook-basal body complex protein [Arcobacter sp.]HIP55939.1 flagellar hook-basal body complex protein [Arcobacter sp.]